MSLRGNIQYFRPRTSVRVTDPAIEPVTVYDLKIHMREVDDTQDRYITNLIKEARLYFENKTNLALISQTRKLLLDAWYGAPEPWWDGMRELPITEIHGGHLRDIEIPVYPLISIDTMTVYDESSNATVVNIANTFDVDLLSTPGRLTLQFGATLPIARRSNNAIEVDYTCGYGTAASDVPADLVQAIKLMAAYMYDNRSGGCTTESAFRKSGAQDIARSYTRARL